MKFYVLFLLLFISQYAQARHRVPPETVTCGQKICPEFVGFWDNTTLIGNAFPKTKELGTERRKGFIEALNWCARDQCNPKLEKETGEYGCYFFRGRQYGDTREATNWTYLVKPKNIQSEMASGSTDNCNYIWRAWDLSLDEDKYKSVTLDFQHPCDKEAVGCRVTLFKDGRQVRIVAYDYDKYERRIKNGTVKTEPGMQDRKKTAAYTLGKYRKTTGNFDPRPVNNDKKNQGVTPVGDKIDENNDKIQNSKNLEQELTGKLLELGPDGKPLPVKKKDEVVEEYVGATRIETDSYKRQRGAPTPDFKKKFDCEQGKFDPGPKDRKTGKKLYVGRDYYFEYTGNPRLGYECVGTSNIEDGKITELCKPGKSIDFFDQITDGRRIGCTGVGGGMTVVILEEGSPSSKTNESLSSCKVVPFFETHLANFPANIVCTGYDNACAKYISAAKDKINAANVSSSLSPVDIGKKQVEYALSLAKLDCSNGI
ncbi:MAG: hypothetical protein KA715_00610 [Xanthomonadaceae bacterium]|nr:hypothetical protein [Xanthomonadaceae bacterium]